MAKDCCKELWARVPDDEPVFTIRGKDKLAEYAVEAWIGEAVRAHVDPDKIAQAREHLLDIKRFQKEHPDRVKLPD